MIAVRADSQVVAGYGLVAALAAPPLLGAAPTFATIAFLATALLGTTAIALYLQSLAGNPPSLGAPPTSSIRARLPPEMRPALLDSAAPRSRPGRLARARREQPDPTLAGTQ